MATRLKKITAKVQDKKRNEKVNQSRIFVTADKFFLPIFLRHFTSNFIQ
jgi:hypothetical protein